ALPSAPPSSQVGLALPSAPPSSQVGLALPSAPPPSQVGLAVPSAPPLSQVGLAVHSAPQPTYAVAREFPLPPKRTVTRKSASVELAKADYDQQPGVVIDYIEVFGGTDY